jgi:hypothetical protein
VRKKKGAPKLNRSVMEARKRGCTVHEYGRPILQERIHTESRLILCNLVVHKCLGSRLLTQDQEAEIGATTGNLETAGVELHYPHSRDSKTSRDNNLSDL